ncbi:MAG: protein-disulfide reductase DsbD, partial [Gammaproteobacteria bacterium]
MPPAYQDPGGGLWGAGKNPAIPAPLRTSRDRGSPYSQRPSPLSPMDPRKHIPMNLLLSLLVLWPLALFAQGASLEQQLGLGEPHFLEPDQAFVFSAEVKGPDVIVARWDIAEGYYLYKKRLRFELKEGKGVRIARVDLPPGEVKEDEFLGRTEVYHKALEARIHLARETQDALPITLEVTYQGCAEAGLCYPPQKKAVSLVLPAGAALEEAPPVAEQDRIARYLRSGSTWLILTSFFIFGLLLAFTPCVFPMIPILSSIIVGQGKDITTGRAFILSLVYVLAMAVTYTLAGVIAGYFGQNLQAAFQNPWVIGAFSLIFVLLALSMFGFYELQLPSSLQSRLSEISGRQKGGTLIGVAIMGFLSALIVGPCVAPPLAGALIYIGQTGDAVLGGMALFALSLGMGAPLLIVGTSAGKLLPKAGPWMDAVKAVFGVLLLAVAIWLLERILPAPLTMLAWATLFITSAVYMGALEGVSGRSGWYRLWKGLGLVLLFYGFL